MRIDASLSHMLLQEQESLTQARYDAPALHAVSSPDVESEIVHTDPANVTQLYRSDPKDIVEFNGIEIDLDDLNNDPENENDEDGLDIRNLTPREMSDFSLDLYIDGSLSFDEYSLLAFQPELHPGFGNTIGALTGERADPDRPRDFIVEWENRLDFEQRYPSENPKTVKQFSRILNVLQSFEQPLDFLT